MKTIKRMLITVAMLLCSVVANAYDFEVNGIYYNIISTSDLTVEVTYGDNKYSGEVIIPETVVYKSKVLKVTSIGEYAFYGCSILKNVTIGNSVTSIGEYAFIYCSGLTSIEIPNSVTSIGRYAFRNCSGLTNVTIGNNVTSISSYAFEYCYGLETVVNLSNLTLTKGSREYGYVGYYADKVINAPNGTIEGDFVFGKVNGNNTLCGYIGNDIELSLPDNYKGENYVIGDSAFYDCDGLTSITIPNRVTSIGEYAFYGCSILKNVTIGNSVTSIGEYAFIYCSGLTNVTIGNSVTSIGGFAFYGCSSLTSIEIPNSVTSIGEYAFRNCTGLTSIEIPNSVTSIGRYAFIYCIGLTNVTIGNSVTSIGNYAFDGCSSLTNVTIGNSVTSIGNYAFYACDSLASIRLLGETPPTVGSDNFTNKQYMNMIVYVPKGTLATYQAADTWKEFWDIREESTTETPEEEVKKCATPVITYNDNGLDITTETDDAEIHTYITCSDVDSFNGGRIDLSATYSITTYATKSGYLNSETATATLCWIAVNGSSEENSIIEVEAMPVLITCNNGTINIRGGKDGAEVVIYTTSGVAVGNATITNGNATISTELAMGEIAVVNIAGKGIKIVMQ